MKRQLPCLVIAVVALLAPSLVAAQGEPASPPAVVVQFLGFTPEQAAQFGQLLQRWQEAMKGVQQNMQAQQLELGRLASTDPPDPLAVGQAFLRIRELGRQAGKVMEDYHQNFAGLLTEEQKHKVHAVSQAAQLLPAVQAFAALQLVAPPPPK